MSNGNFSDKNSGNNSPEPSKLAQIFTVLAMVFGGIMGIFIFVVLAKAKDLPASEDSEYLADSPLLPWVLVVIISAALMGICLVIATSKFVRDTKKAAGGGRKVIYTLDASVLRDPRIKQLPEVQRLLQYESVQKAFFNGEFPDDDDPHLQELADVLAKRADENGVIRL